jgi:para-nitrobenzyl esterase
LAKQGVVVVTANYRLGVMGFLAHPALDAESANSSSGNYALLDQLMALRWIQQNIGAFGGDPQNVTLFGQSSGGFDVLLLVTSPLSAGLFQHAISESGQILSYGGPMTKAAAETMGQSIATALNAPQGSDASTLAYLRSLPASQVVTGAGQWTSGTATLPGTTTGLLTNVDGWVLPDVPGKIFSDGKEMAIPLMVGNNAREIMPESLFPGYTTADLVQDVSTFYGPVYGPQALVAYGLDNGGTGITDPLYGNAGAQFWTDTVQRCAAIMEANWHAAANHPTFEYQFDHAWPNLASGGATHGAEVPYVFGTLDAVTPTEPWTSEDYQTSTQMQTYWTNFAKTGNPNGSSLPTWPQAGSGQYLEFTASAGPQSASNLQPLQCGVFENWANAKLGTVTAN